ncbi:DUF1634 domain-containing protein [Thermus tengchongensis]|uniref:DUF1634 domain-containing protein n=1 Tax=Thermus tengchongensis TaxID=1214928 RepID=UPI001F17DC6D|nr:DUF1634 domain-containing protein [Thermus tengchongensis]
MGIWRPTGVPRQGWVPRARVALSVFLFLEEKDYGFALITLWVLLILLASLL